MKIQFIEESGCFHVSLQAESVEDAAALVRMGMNSTRELRSCGAEVYNDGTVFGYVVIGKSKKSDSRVLNRGTKR